VYRDNDLRLSSGGQTVTFEGRSHILHYDALLTGGSSQSRVRPYVAFGGGIKVYQGTGTEQEFQPLGQFAALTKTHEWVPVVSVGAGVRFRIMSHAFLRFDVRDYLTPFPTEVVAPAQGASVKGWLHDITPMVGISVFF
jgi:hypothetical protein